MKVGGVLDKNVKNIEHGIAKKFTCRLEIALNMMRLFSQSMLLRASSGEGMKSIESSKVILLFQNDSIKHLAGCNGAISSVYLHFWILCRYFRASTITWAIIIWCFLCCPKKKKKDLDIKHEEICGMRCIRGSRPFRLHRQKSLRIIIILLLINRTSGYKNTKPCCRYLQTGSAPPATCSTCCSRYQEEFGTLLISRLMWKPILPRQIYALCLPVVVEPMMWDAQWHTPPLMLVVSSRGSCILQTESKRLASYVSQW